MIDLEIPLGVSYSREADSTATKCAASVAADTRPGGRTHDCVCVTKAGRRHDASPGRRYRIRAFRRDSASEALDVRVVSLGEASAEDLEKRR